MGKVYKMIDYNKKYIFISKKGEWFKEDAECIIDGTLISYKHGSDIEITFKEMILHPENIAGTFKGLRICETPKSENRNLGEEYYDGEFCPLNEFIILKRDEVIEERS